MKPSSLQKHLKTQNDDDQREYQPKISTSSLKTQKVCDEGEQRTEVHCPPPPFFTEIRKMHYVLFINIYIYIYKYIIIVIYVEHDITVIHG